MDFFILFAMLGLVALARVAVGLAAAPYGAFDWAAVRAQILNSLGAEAIASRAQRAAVTQRRAAKRHRRWSRRAALAEGRAQALSAAKAARLAVRAARKAAARAKSADVALRYGHAAQRAAAAVHAHRRLVAAGRAAPVALSAGIKAKKRATRGSTVAANAQKRAARLVVAQQRNAAARAAADAANDAFAARMAAEKAARKAAEAAANDAFAARMAALQAARKAAEAAAAKERARRAALAALLADKNAVRLAHAVVRVGAKAQAKEDFLHWLDSNGHTCRGEAFVAANEAAWTAVKAEEGYLAHFGFSPEVIVAADKAVYERRAEARAVRASRQGKAVVA